jgi:raffinose/stachyose/melibiose transport system substrate-binding protein
MRLIRSAARASRHPDGSSRRTPAIRFLSAIAAVALVAGACSSGAGTPTASSATTPASAAANTSAAASSASQPVALTAFTAAGLKDQWQAQIDAFHAKYPNITITLQTEADTNYDTVVKRNLASDTPPDVVLPMPDMIGAVKNNLVLNLDSYAKKYDWASKVPASALAAQKVADGKKGAGSLYAAGGSAGSLVGIMYNKALAAQIGMTQPPATIADLEADMAKAKSMGITPIIASNSDGLVGHLYALLLSDYMGPKTVLDWVWLQPNANLNTPEAVAATTELQKWVQAGYFNADANAINQDASYGQFAGGKGLFFFQGTWITGVLPKNFDGQYGFLPFPPATAGGTTVSMTGNNLVGSIAAKSKNPDAAAAFLDFLSTAEAAAIAQKFGYAASAPGATATITMDGTITQQIQNAYTVIANNDGFTDWLQNSVPEIGAVEMAQLQMLLANKVNPADLVKKMQDTYAAALSQ